MTYHPSSANKTTKKNVSNPPTKFCKDCQHYSKYSDDDTIRMHVCRSPFNSYRDVVTGEIKEKVDNAYDARASDLFCGIEGKWFIPFSNISPGFILKIESE